MARKSGIRLSGGQFRGRILEVPRSARPTEGRLREALFSIWGSSLSDSSLLDLFAGSGAVGLEAAGRGALEVLAVESDPQALAVLQRNARLLAAEGFHWRRLSLPTDLDRLVQEGLRFDFIFADPPYGFEEVDLLLEALPALLAPDGEVALEHSSRRQVPLEVGLPESSRQRETIQRLVRVDQRSYGESCLSFYRVGPT